MRLTEKTINSKSLCQIHSNVKFVQKRNAAAAIHTKSQQPECRIPGNTSDLKGHMLRVH